MNSKISSHSLSSYSLSSWAVLIALALLMVATRAFHIGSTLHLPDASWAVFFLAGFYLGFAAFGVLLFEAVAIDLIYLMNGGDPYCFSVAYAVLVFAYLTLWFGGRWSGRAQRGTGADLLYAFCGWLISAPIAYLLSNGSFYWLSGKAVDPSLAGWLQNARIWAFGFIVQPVMYLVVAAVAHVIVRRLHTREVVAA